VRLFLAINPGAEVKTRIDEAMEPLRGVAPGLRWVAADRLHLTVKFLGEQPTSIVPALSQAVDAAVARHGDAPLALGGVGAFPNFRRARVVWLGVEPHPRLELLHHDIEESCAALGFEPDGRPFRPHLTVARVPDGTAGETLRALSRAARAASFSETVDVESVDLMVSEPTSAGPRYRLLHASGLRTATRGDAC
jgi:2'-5' RNA ligase